MQKCLIQKNVKKKSKREMKIRKRKKMIRNGYEGVIVHIHSGNIYCEYSWYEKLFFSDISETVKFFS